MDNRLVLLTMIAISIFADYKLNFTLDENKFKEKKYFIDRLMMCILHSFLWAFLVSIPIIVVREYKVANDIFIFIFIATALHALVEYEIYYIKCCNHTMSQTMILALIMAYYNIIDDQKMVAYGIAMIVLFLVGLIGFIAGDIKDSDKKDTGGE